MAMGTNRWRRWLDTLFFWFITVLAWIGIGVVVGTIVMGIFLAVLTILWMLGAVTIVR